MPVTKTKNGIYIFSFKTLRYVCVALILNIMKSYTICQTYFQFGLKYEKCPSRGVKQNSFLIYIWNKIAVEKSWSLRYELFWSKPMPSQSNEICLQVFDQLFDLGSPNSLVRSLSQDVSMEYTGVILFVFHAYFWR